MRINFQQGIVKYPHSGVIQQFLSKASNTVNLNTFNGHVDVTFAHGASNYLLTETTTVPAAWNGIPPNTDIWLYWDINKRTGIRTFGYTAVLPTEGPSAPGSPVQDQHWFDTTTKKMYVYNSGAFREVIRVFAAKVNNATFTPMGSSPSPTQYAGSQVGLTNISTLTGRILFDGTGLPVRKPSGELFTTEDDFFVSGSPVNAIRLESNVMLATAVETIAKYHVVKFTGVGQVALAGYDDAGDEALAITVDDVVLDGTCTCILQGVITNPGWDWATVGAELWVLEDGMLVDVDPHISAPLTYTTSRVGVGRVLSPTSIIFSQAVGGRGEQGAPGTPGSTPDLDLNDLTDVTIATPLSTQVLRYNGSAWVNTTLPTIPAALNDLTDVTISAPASDNVLTYSGGSWINAPASTPSLAVEDLTNVTITTPSAGNLLTYSGGSWINAPAALPSLAVEDLSNVTITTPSNGHVLTYSSGSWVNTSIAPGGGTVLTIPPQNTAELDWDGVIEIRVALTSNIGTMDITNMTGAYDGQRMMFKVTQSVEGDVTLTFSAANIRIPSDIPSTALSMTSGAIHRYGFIYDATDGKYDMVAFIKGF
jgi:hypothetical protein